MVLRLPFLIACTLLLVKLTAAQPVNSSCQRARTLVQMMEKFHYKPLVLNDSVSIDLFTRVIDELDEDALFFTQKDIEKLSLYRTALDDELRTQGCGFITALTTLYRQKLRLADSLVSVLLQKPLDFSSRDSLILYNSGEEIVFTKEEKELKARWTKWLKYQLLDELFATENADSVDERPVKEIFSKEAEARNKVRAKEKRYFASMLDDQSELEKYVADTYLNALAEQYDPHSSYFSPGEKKKFDEELSTTGSYFGFSIEENKSGSIIITHLVPGGPAWKSNELNNDDLLLAVKFPGKKEVDLSFADINEAENILNSSDAEEIELTVGKLSGEIKKVKLVKETLQSDENVIKSYVLHGNQKVGYISLPAFYTEPDDPSGSGCANDVARELMKLQKENIEGLILDLRNNGGGSMQEALDLAGIFINEGPLCLAREKKKKALTLKDMNRGTIYNGPLVLLVNGASASASELVSIALQDYNRAVIVGGTTFGKGTIQVVLPMDTSVSFDMKEGVKKIKTEQGYTKVTIGKFYRVTGNTHQQKGVQPDVTLPYWFDNIKFREVYEPHALAADTVLKKVYFTPLPPLPLEKLKSKSNERTATDRKFNDIKSLRDSLTVLLEQKNTIPLFPEAYRKEKQKLHNTFNLLDNVAVNDTANFTVENNQYDKELFKMDSFRNEINTDVLKKIQEDIYLHESYRIMKDLIMFEKN